MSVILGKGDTVSKLNINLINERIKEWHARTWQRKLIQARKIREGFQEEMIFKLRTEG